MDRAEIIRQMATSGIDEDVLRKTPDQALESWWASLQRDKVEKYAARMRRAFAEAGAGDSQELPAAFARFKSGILPSPPTRSSSGAGVSMTGGVPDTATELPAADARRDAGRSDRAVSLDPGEGKDRLKPRGDQVVSQSTMGLVSPSEIRKVEKHYESFAETFQRLSTSKDELVQAFRSQAARMPGLTAERFLNPGGR